MILLPFDRPIMQNVLIVPVLPENHMHFHHLLHCSENLFEKTQILPVIGIARVYLMSWDLTGVD